MDRFSDWKLSSVMLYRQLPRFASSSSHIRHNSCANRFEQGPPDAMLGIGDRYNAPTSHEGVCDSSRAVEGNRAESYNLMLHSFPQTREKVTDHWGLVLVGRWELLPNRSILPTPRVQSESKHFISLRSHASNTCILRNVFVQSLGNNWEGKAEADTSLWRRIWFLCVENTLFHYSLPVGLH